MRALIFFLTHTLPLLKQLADTLTCYLAARKETIILGGIALLITLALEYWITLYMDKIINEIKELQ